MRILLDEHIPAPLLELLRIDESHAFAHVNDLSLTGTPDAALFKRARELGFDTIVSLDRNQLTYEREWRALRRARLHHVSLRQSRATQGERGTLRMVASIAVAIPRVLDFLAACDSPQVVEIALLSDSKRFDAISHHQHEQGKSRV